MNDFNRESRALRMRYDMERNRINIDFNRRQVDLTCAVSLAKNELYHMSTVMRYRTTDEEDARGMRVAIDVQTERVHTLERQKVDLDFERKQALLELEQRRTADIIALEDKYANTADRKEVVAL